MTCRTSAARGSRRGRWPGVDVAIDFFIAAAVEDNMRGLAALGISVVIGTTGWDEARMRVREMADRSGIGVVAAPNFSTGAILVRGDREGVRRGCSAPARTTGRTFTSCTIRETDAPSGTALSLKAALESAGYARPIDVASTRAGSMPGTHTVGFDGPSDTITLTHTVRDRGTFARGALVAAQWVQGRRGWYTMHDVLGLTGASGASSRVVAWPSGRNRAIETGGHQPASDACELSVRVSSPHLIPRMETGT